MSDLRRWAKRRAMRSATGLVPVEVDVHTEHGTIRAIRYHRAEDAKKLIAEGKARSLKEVELPSSAQAPPPVSVSHSKPSEDYPHGKYRFTEMAQEKVGWKTSTGVPVDVTVTLHKEETDHLGNGTYRLSPHGYSTQIRVSLGGKPEEGGQSINLQPVMGAGPAVAKLGRIGLIKENYEKVKTAIAKVEAHPEFRAHQERVAKSIAEGEAHDKHVRDVENMMTVGGRST